MNDGSQDNARLAALQDAVSKSARLTQDAVGATHTATASYLVVRVGPRWLAMPATAIREVVLKGAVTRIPLSPPHVLGVAVIRGRVVPVVSLEAVLGTADDSELVPTLPRLVVVETADAEIAIATDEVRGINELPVASLRDEAAGGGRLDWVAAEIAWENRLLCVVNVQRLVMASLDEQLTS